MVKIKLIGVQNVCDEIIKNDSSVRFAGICTGDGVILDFKYSTKIAPLLSKKETQRSAILSAIRYKTRQELKSKVGNPIYAVTAYQNVKRATIYIDENLLLLISFDKSRDEYSVMKNILSLIQIQKPEKLLQFINSVSLMMEERSQKEKHEAIGNLSAKMAHDMKNPLTIIEAAVDRIHENLDPDDSMKPSFERIHRAIYRMSHQIDDVLNYVKSDKLSKTKTSLHEILTLVISEMPYHDNVLIKIAKNDESVICDPEKIRIVFTNIILNAIQAIKNKGTIKIKIHKLVKSVKIDFEDSGNDLNKKDLSKVFEPLFSTKQHGTGLGLASCKSIIELHGGTISVQNNPTIFTVSLPL